MGKSPSSALGLPDLGARFPADRRRVRCRWAAAADRVLPDLDERPRRDLLTLVIDPDDGVALQDLRGAERARRPWMRPSTTWRERERASRIGIGFVETTSGQTERDSEPSNPETVETIAAWAQSKAFDAAIWTALPEQLRRRQCGEPFSVTAALAYLEKLGSEGATSFPPRSPTFARPRPRWRPRSAIAWRNAGPADGNAGPRRTLPALPPHWQAPSATLAFYCCTRVNRRRAMNNADGRNCGGLQDFPPSSFMRSYRSRWRAYWER